MHRLGKLSYVKLKCILLVVQDLHSIIQANIRLGRYLHFQYDILLQTQHTVEIKHSRELVLCLSRIPILMVYICLTTDL